MGDDREDRATGRFNCTPEERAVFEAGIKLATIYHQFVGTPFCKRSVHDLEKSIQSAIETQPYVESARVRIVRDGGDKSDEYTYSSLDGDSIDAVVTIRIGDVRAVAEMRYDDELKYPLMYVSSVGRVRRLDIDCFYTIQPLPVMGDATLVNNIKIGITGLPISGKTYALRHVIEMLGEKDVKIGGMIDEKIMDGRRATGMKVTNIQTGESVVFASPEIESKITVGSLGVDLSLFESVAIEAIKTACETCDLIVIDEVGKVEVESEAFVDAVKDALDEDKPMIITLHKKSRNPLLQDIRRRDDVRILEITPTNRNLLPYKIMTLMTGEAQ